MEQKQIRLDVWGGPLVGDSRGLAAVIPALSHRGGFSVLCFQPSAIRPSLIPEKSEPPLSPLWDLRPCGGQQSLYVRSPKMRPSDATPGHPPNLERLPQKLWVTAGRHPDRPRTLGIVPLGQMPTNVAPPRGMPTWGAVRVPTR